MIKAELWPAIHDDSSVERLILAIQQAIAATAPTVQAGEVGRGIEAPDVANALAIVSATILATSPACATPQGMRKLAEAAGRELHRLMRDTRQFQHAAAQTMKTLQ